MSKYSPPSPIRVLLVGTLLSALGCTTTLPWNRSASQEPSVLDQGQQVDVQLALGRTFEKQQQWDAAQTVYNEILHSDAQQAQAAHRLAIVYDRQGDIERASHWFAKALEIAPENTDVICDLGYSSYRQGNLTEAESRFRQTLDLDPHHRRARNHLGLVLASRGRQEEALAEFQRAGCTPSEAHSNLAYALLIHHQLDEAASELQIAMQAAAGSPAQRDRFEAVASLITDAEAARTASVPDSAPQY